MRQVLRSFALAVAGLVTALSGGGLHAEPPAAPAAPPAVRDVGALLAPLVERHKVPALCGGIVVGPRLGAAGVAGVRRRGFPERATLDDRWHLGSCTKAMTATLCAMLDAEGKLSLDATLEKALGAATFKRLGGHDGWRTATIEGLLRHRAGAPANLDVGGLWGRLWRRNGSAREQREQLLEGLLPQAPGPTTAFVYSNAGYAIAGLCCERAVDQPYEALMAKRLFAPLGITSAGFGAPGVEGRADEPRGHTSDGKPIEPGPQADNPPSVAPAGTLHMTLADWARFAGLHLEAAQGRSKLLTKAQAQRLHAPPAGVEPAYAAGWMVMDRAWGGRVLTHSGSNTMWFCVAWLAPEKGFGVLVCVNEAGEHAQKAADEAAWALIQDHLSANR
jgi:CubicO group peptidase (beta-lactamase class C family)